MVATKDFNFKNGDRVFFEDENTRERVKAIIRQIENGEARVETSRSAKDEWIPLSRFQKIEVTTVNNTTVNGNVTNNITINESPPKKRKRNSYANFYYLLGKFTDEHLRTLTRNEIAVWLVLFRDSHNGFVKTAVTDIATRTGIHVRTVSRTVHRLIGLKLLRITKKGGHKRGVTEYEMRSGASHRVQRENP